MEKKSFKDNVENPAMPFISASQQGENEVIKKIPEEIPDGYKINHELVETKSKRIQVLLQQSLKEDAKKKARAQGISLNELVCRAIREYIEK